jgi:hypothetical protein
LATVRSRYVNGQLAFYEGHRMRLVDAVGSSVYKYELRPDILGATTTDPRGWTTTVVEAGSGTTEWDVNNTAGRVGTITCAANEDDGGSYQLLGENIELTSDQDVYVGAKLKINDVDQTDLFFGLAVTDTALLGGVADAVYFESVDGSASISTVTEKDSTETQNDSAGTLADDTDILLEFYFDGSSSSVYFFIDGSLVNTHTANIPDDEALRLTIEFLTGEATANTCDVQFMRVIQIGR